MPSPSPSHTASSSPKASNGIYGSSDVPLPENLIPITLNAKYVLLISYEENGNDDINLYKRMKFLYPQNHISI